MKKYLPKILIGSALISGFVLFANSVLAVPAPTPPPVIKFESGCGSSNTSPSPLFSETNFLPGDSKTCWIKVTNLNSIAERIAVEARHFADPILIDDLARALNIEIKNGGAILYGANGTKSLYDFYNDSGIPNGEDNKEIYLGTLEPNSPTQRYDITISFPTDKGDYWQGKTTGFDIVWGFQSETGGGPNDTIYPDLMDSGNNGSGNGSGGGFGGYYDENGAEVVSEGQVAGESVSRETEQTGGQPGGSGGFVAAAETGPTESISPTPTAPAVAGESACSPIPWWPFGYVLLLLILGVAQKMEKKVSVGGIVLQIVLLIAALLWWWLEPCGAHFWVWPVLMLIVFLVSFRFYLKKSSSEETPA